MWRRDKPAQTRPGGPDALPVILHGILHFSRKALLFALNGGTILLLVPTRFCGRIRRNFAWCGQNRPDKTACFDPGGAQTAFGTQNSKCFRSRERRVGSTPTISAIKSKRYRCHWRKASGINRFRAFSAQKFTDDSIDANRCFPLTGGIRTPSSRRLAKPETM